MKETNEGIEHARALIRECLETKDTFLDIGNCGITDLDDLPELFECTHLETLIISNDWYDNNKKSWISSKNKGHRNHPEYLSNNIKKLKNLKQFYFGGGLGGSWSITDVATLKHLDQLNTLDLRSNKISDISFLKDLKQLNTLYLSSNKISDFSFLKDLMQLNTLYLSYNKISDISFLKDLKQLNTLDLSYNKISDISFLKDLMQLNTLYLSSNNISDFSFLKDLMQLNTLDLSSNKISDISFLKDLMQLNTLDLSSNKISDISFLKDLKQLNTLDLSYNNISDISFLKDLMQLNTLYLSYNNISELPVWVTNFKMDISLKQFGRGIRLYKNPIEKPPMEIVEQGKEAIINYFNYSQYYYLFEAKLILVGEERAGKSTIVKALSDEKFAINLNEKSTEGIDITEWVIPKDKVDTKKDYRFNIWDFGGQEIYHATHQFFLTKRSLYLFVTEARKDLRFDDFYYWLNIINSLAGKSPVILIQNKVDQSHQDIAIERYVKDFPQIHDGIKKISCNTEHKNWLLKYCHILEELKGTIFTIIKEKQIDGIGDELPIEWIDIRKKISKIEENTISLIYYLDICKKHGLDEERAIFLSDYFHDLGVFLHFRKDLNLRNIIFLNHEWVTKAIYNVFDNDKIKNESKGKFYEDDLIEIWNEPQFKGKEADLLNLMKTPQFKICYQHKNGYYVAPQLFDDKVVDYHWETYDNNLLFRYKYGFMPKGILSQLIVELNQYIFEDTFWKYGVLLEYKESKAIVIEDRYGKENIISIRVEGENKRSFLTIIKKCIEDINASYTNLQVDEEIGCNCQECKDSEERYFWKITNLNRAMKKGKREVECQISFEDVRINHLLGDYIPQRESGIIGDENDSFSINIYRNERGIYKTEFDKLHKRHDRHDQVHDELIDKFNQHYHSLIALPENKVIKDLIIPEIQQIAIESREVFLNDVLIMLSKAFEFHQSDMDDKLLKLYNELKKDLQTSGHTEVKIKTSIPLLNLIGLDIGVEKDFDIKAWGAKMNEKYGLRLFTMLG
ncbi:MAG: COR domain-containing protein [Bacteroidota bacterium]